MDSKPASSRGVSLKNSMRISLLAVVVPLARVSSSSFVHWQSCNHIGATSSIRHVILSPLNSDVANKESDQESNFWFTVIRKESEEDTRTVPVLPSLDTDGPLPPSAYRTFGNDECQPKPTCVLSVAIDLQDLSERYSTDPNIIVSSVQNFIESGLTTFQLGRCPERTRQKQKPQPIETANDRIQMVRSTDDVHKWAEEHIYGRIQKNMPKSVMEKYVNLVVPFRAENSQLKKDMVRQAITESLSRIGADSIDNLQLTCKWLVGFYVCFFVYRGCNGITSFLVVQTTRGLRTTLTQWIIWLICKETVL